MQALFSDNGYLTSTIFSAPAWAALEQAREIARLSAWDSLRTPQLVVGILKKADTVIVRWSEFAGLDLQNLGEQLELLFKQNVPPNSDPLPLNREFCSDNLLKLLQTAQNRASGNARAIEQSDILLACLRDRESVVSLSFKQAGLNVVDLATLLEAAEHAEKAIRRLA